MREKNLGLDDQVVPDSGPSLHRRPFRAEIEHFSFVNQLLARQHLSMKTRPGNFGQHHVLTVVIRLADQERCVALNRATGDAEALRWAELHADIIRRFGRFPHRNRALGRATTPEEQAFLDAGGFSG